MAAAIPAITTAATLASTAAGVAQATADRPSMPGSMPAPQQRDFGLPRLPPMMQPGPSQVPAAPNMQMPQAGGQGYDQTLMATLKNLGIR